MKVLTVMLTYGNRSFEILKANLDKTGYPTTHTVISREGISNALNDGLDLMIEHNFDAVAFLSNDIIEPKDWLKKKVEAIETYPDAGVVASSLDCGRTTITNELIISNYLISRKTFEKVGYFNESMFPYGPIDLDYCERCYAAGLKTYYVMDCLAIHQGFHAIGDEYGWEKAEFVSKYMSMLGKYNKDNFKLDRL